MIIALFSILGLISQSASQSVKDEIDKYVTGTTQHVIDTAIRNVTDSGTGATIAFVIGLVVALWSASKYTAAFMRSSNAIYGVEESRPVWKKIPVRFGVTAAIVILLALIALGVAVSGGVARQVGDSLGLGSTTVTIWNVLKWPVMALLVAMLLGVLYWGSPNVRRPGILWIGPGGVVAVGVALLASGGFAVFIALFGSFNKTYGAMASVIIFLVWCWIINLAVLLGATLNAELERTREIQAGRPDDVHTPNHAGGSPHSGTPTPRPHRDDGCDVGSPIVDGDGGVDMDHKGVLVELFGRIDGHVASVLDGLNSDDLTWAPQGGANPIGWLIWHIARVIDHQVSDVAGVDQVWVGGDWAAGFGLEPDPDNSGYGHAAADVTAVRPRDVGILGAYYARVSEATRDFLSTLDGADLDRIVDERWDPPVTLGVRLVSVADDAIQHAGQAAYIKGMLPD